MVRAGARSANHSEGLYDRLRGTGQAGQIPSFIVVRRYDGAIVNQADERIGTADDLRLICSMANRPSSLNPPQSPMRRPSS